MKSLRLFALVSFALCAGTALAERLEIALHIPIEPIRQALSAQLSSRPIYREGRCRYLTLQAPKLDGAEGYLQLVVPGAAALGVEMLGQCQSAAAWQGSVELKLLPQIDAAGRLRLRIVDSRLTPTDGAHGPALGLISELAKRHVHPRLQRFVFDIGASRAALLAALKSVAPAPHAAELEEALARLEVLEPRVAAGVVALPIALDIPEAWRTARPPAMVSNAPLSEAEIEALERALEPWDAFLVYSLKQLALDSENSALRRRLFTLLLDSRYQLVAILAGEVRTSGDPVRELFVDAWNELRAILADAQREGLLGASLLRYAMFIDAGDALIALDRAAPGLGLHFSADGLRQLARTLQPGVAGDPLAYAWSVDAELRRLFQVEGVAEPAPPPGRSWLDLFIRSAHAASPPAALDRWVPRRNELDAYQARVAEVLQKTAAAELARAALAAPYANIYEHLVPTTALIESCWRQYVVRRAGVTYLRSQAGSVGIMQINQRVWRGFYDVQRLRWDTAYNTRAGAQILMRYLKDYAIPYGERSGDVNDVPRAAYAVYNAGPRAVGRFAKATPHPREKRVDDRLWSLYRGIASGGQPDLRTCDVTIAAASR